MSVKTKHHLPPASLDNALWAKLNATSGPPAWRNSCRRKFRKNTDSCKSSDREIIDVNHKIPATTILEIATLES
jgi:hypothetical protein